MMTRIWCLAINTLLRLGKFPLQILSYVLKLKIMYVGLAKVFSSSSVVGLGLDQIPLDKVEV